MNGSAGPSPHPPTPRSRARDGDHVPEDRLVARTEEFLAVARGVHGQRPFSRRGGHFEVQDGGFDAPLNRVRFRVFLQGESEEAFVLSARRRRAPVRRRPAGERCAT